MCNRSPDRVWWSYQTGTTYVSKSNRFCGHHLIVSKIIFPVLQLNVAAYSWCSSLFFADSLNYAGICISGEERKCARIKCLPSAIYVYIPVHNSAVKVGMKKESLAGGCDARQCCLLPTKVYLVLQLVLYGDSDWPIRWQEEFYVGGQMGCLSCQ